MDNVITSDPYALVLADLRAKREQIDQAIAALESLQSGSFVALTGAPPPPSGSGEAVAAPGALLGLSIADAAKSILLMKRRQLTTPEIVSELERGGVVLTSSDKNNTVGSLLLRRFYNVGDIVRVNRGVWGMQEWYPGRKFAKGNKVGEEREGVISTKEAEQEVTAFDRPAPPPPIPPIPSAPPPPPEAEAPPPPIETAWDEAPRSTRSGGWGAPPAPPPPVATWVDDDDIPF